ncbi:hypothetical protein [Zunongwangia sp.]|uniref:hypothetical protein n=1 Tax=Zunongwangia sp. TaxID=1965325 RepID=UPI003AA7D5B6
MKFPLLNISNPNWQKEEDLMSFLLLDNYSYKDDIYFERYLKDELFCDCKGSIFKITGKKGTFRAYKKLFGFLPEIYKTRLIFEKTNTYISLEDFREYLMDRVASLGYGVSEVKLLLKLKKATSHEELILVFFNAKF